MTQANPSPNSTNQTSANQAQAQAGAKSGGCLGCAGRGCVGVILIAITLLIIVAAGGWYMWRHVPSHVAKQQDWLASTPDSELQQRAVALENRLPGEISAWTGDPATAPPTSQSASPTDAGITSSFDPDNPHRREIVINLHDANAWLATRLSQWSANQGSPLPSFISPPTISHDDGRLVIAGRITTSRLDQIISVRAHIAIVDDKNMRVTLDKLRAGSMPIPVGNVVGEMRKAMQNNPNADKLDYAAQLFDEGIVVPSTISVDESRQVRLAAWDIDADEIRLTVETEPKP